jgi:mannose/cellobiose epimerase-like protein (N-acyl-D-glucosamine 2-epimerase family)/anti-anti-sigma regulatory factor
MKRKNMHFTFSDTIAGYVTHFDWDKDLFTLKTSHGEEYDVKLTANTFAEMVRNLGEDFIDCTGRIKDMLEIGRFIYAHGIFFPEGEELNFEVKHIVFLGEKVDEYRFEKQDWWIQQVRSLADFYLKAQFGDGEIDYSKYRTTLTLEGEHIGTYRQETDTISRLVYGFASAYLMTGEDRYLEAAEKGTKYLRDHMRSVDKTENIAYWCHGIDVKDGKERKILASEFGDDYDAIPAYEQIYALAGPTQTYRITGDTEILEDIDMTLNLFDKYFLDKDLGGYFSHIDPVSFDPRTDSLGKDRARKNWNSIGDHAPAYLINAWLATGNTKYKEMLKYTADTITDHFQDYDNSSFVQEKFHEDWSHDTTWGWQQNRGVVGHNLKIAWNLTRINSVTPDERYMTFANKIAEIMPTVGGDMQRGGWYDVMERKREEGQEFNRLAWHDRKAWWQQEQGILAYMILAGVSNDKNYLKLARESTAFYNAWFLDHDSGAVYFNVLANGIPYLLGTERMKGSHSMSGYHAFELAYLAAVYSNLLLTKQPLELHFKPTPNALPGNLLRVAPDILPQGSVLINKVWVDGQAYDNFDAENLTVTLPKGDTRVKVKVQVMPTLSQQKCTITTEVDAEICKIVLAGDLNEEAFPLFQEAFNTVKAQGHKKIALEMKSLSTICSECIRFLMFEKQKMDIDKEIYIIGANATIKEALDINELTEEVILLSEYDRAAILH